VGRDVVFGAGQYAPRTAEGRRLLAHELAHVIQQGVASSEQHSMTVSQPTDMQEQQADQIAASVALSVPYNARWKDISTDVPRHRLVNSIGGAGRIPGPVVQRDVTRPRTATGKQIIKDVTTETESLTGKVTAGSLAATEWESLFQRHFTEPDKIEEEVESSHARYFYSRIYGWVDAQHFFAHIQFAEDLGLEGATEKGIEIEKKQEMVRTLIGPEEDDPTIYSDFLKENLIGPDDFLHYREELFMAISAGLKMFLSDQERALIKGFDDRQLGKLILDSAKSAWSAEDLVSNQLGVQFFRLYGTYINAGADATEVRQRFIAKITEFFTSIGVVNSPAMVRKLTRSLPGKERWMAPKLTEAKARKRFPELFKFDKDTHRLRIAVYDTEALAEKKKGEVAKLAPSASALFVFPYGTNSYALYTGSVSHFEAVVLKSLIDRAIPTGAGGALVEVALPLAGP
jgi:hypothetical protein